MFQGLPSPHVETYLLLAFAALERACFGESGSFGRTRVTLGPSKQCQEEGLRAWHGAAGADAALTRLRCGAAGRQRRGGVGHQLQRQLVDGHWVLAFRDPGAAAAAAALVAEHAGRLRRHYAAALAELLQQSGGGQAAPGAGQPPDSG